MFREYVPAGTVPRTSVNARLGIGRLLYLDQMGLDQVAINHTQTHVYTHINRGIVRVKERREEIKKERKLKAFTLV